MVNKMTKLISIPWAAWRDPKSIDLKFPDKWQVNICRMKGAENIALTDDEIKDSITNPIRTPRISELARGKNNIVIVVDDLTRTTPVFRIIPYVIEELNSVGINREQITILLAIGAHKPMNKKDCIKKLGKDIVENYRIENHHPYENLTELGESSLGTPIDINTTYYNADVKIAISGVIPHLLAGFGGGGKIVLPGVSGIRTLEANHSAGLRGIGAGIGRITGVREDIEEIVKKVGLDFSINLTFNEIGEITGIASGHFIGAHRKAIELANRSYSTKITRQNDICFLNSFPEDSELNQSLKALTFLLTTPKNFLSRKGTIVIMTSSYEGKGYHSLLGETGSRLYDNFENNLIWRSFVKKKPVYFYSPNISETDLYHYYPKNVKLYNEWNDLIEELSKVYGESPKATIVPTSIQLYELGGN